MAKQALGRGLGALLKSKPGTDPSVGDVLDAMESGSVEMASGERVREIAIDKVIPCPFQPRKDFSEDALRELSDSIREQGILQPLIVRQRSDSKFEIIAGERRWRAAKLIGLPHVPALVRKVDDHKALEIALIENLQRENLNPIEESRGFMQLIGQYNLTQEEVAAKVGKSRVSITNALRLLKLDKEVQGYVRDGLLSVGHAKVILGLSSEEDQRAGAQRAIRDGLNVRQTEELVSEMQLRKEHSAPNGKHVDPNAAPVKEELQTEVKQIQNKLREYFSTKVNLRYRKGKGSVEIRFYSDEELEKILQLMQIEPEKAPGES
jgi:ParB family chromosome partitioning protein